MRNILTTEGLRDWLKHKNPTEGYNYLANTGCLLFQYFKESGLNVFSVSACFWRDHENFHVERPFAPEMEDIALEAPWTFGAALARAEAVCASRT